MYKKKSYYYFQHSYFNSDVVAISYISTPGNWRKNHKFKPLVGAFSEANFDVQSISLSQGDSLLFYTDGVTEAQNIKQEF